MQGQIADKARLISEAPRTARERHRRVRGDLQCRGQRISEAFAKADRDCGVNKKKREFGSD
jgi:hypothetical protein